MSGTPHDEHGRTMTGKASNRAPSPVSGIAQAGDRSRRRKIWRKMKTRNKARGAGNVPHLRRNLGGLIVPMLGICNPRVAAMQVLDLHVALAAQLRELIVQVFLDLRADVVWALRRHETADMRWR